MRFRPHFGDTYYVLTDKQECINYEIYTQI